MSARRVTLYDVGPRDGLQNEPDVLDVETRAELVRRLAATGLPAIEVASFVDPRRVPQMAHAEEVVAAVGETPGVIRAGLALNERGYERLVASGLDEVRFAFGVTESFNQRNQGASVDESLAAATRIVSRAREDGLRSTVTLSVAFGCPFEGEVDPAHVLDVAEPGRRRGTARRARPRGHDRRRRAGAVRSLVTSAARAGRPGRRALPQHAQHRVRERAGGARGRRGRARRVGRRARRLSLRTERDREHRDRGSRLRARTRGRRDGRRPRGADRRRRRGSRSVLGRRLDGQLYRAGSFPS